MLEDSKMVVRCEAFG